jgi:long-chain acyl-CoA synthetase
MSDPLASLPLALAAAGGRVDQYEARQLVAAGLTLLQRCAPLARALLGRRAAILAPTGPHFLVALAACEGRGAVLVNPLAAAAEVAHQCADADVGAVLTVSALAAKVPAGLPVVLLDEAPRSATVQLDERTLTVDLGSHFALELAGDAETPGRDEEAAIVYTSAMAGTPIGAVLTHANLLANGRSTVEAARLTADDHCLAVLPFSHLFGLTVTLSAPLLAGARTTTMARFNPLKALDLLESSGITMLVGVPAVFIALLAAAERRGGVRPDALRLAICGGAPLPVAVQERWEAVTGVALRQGYGLTEASPVCLFNRVDRPNRPGTLGVAYPDCEVTIRDPRTSAPLGTGESGEICVRGALVGPGYVRNGDAGLKQVAGWLHTGDRGRMDAEGVVTFEGLLKPMFTRNGFNIYPAELERVIGTMPGVSAVEVRAIPDPVKEHEVGVRVHGDVTVDAVKAWCEALLSAYKQPSEVTIVPA